MNSLALIRKRYCVGSWFLLGIRWLVYTNENTSDKYGKYRGLFPIVGKFRYVQEHLMPYFQSVIEFRKWYEATLRRTEFVDYTGVWKLLAEFNLYIT